MKGKQLSFELDQNILEKPIENIMPESMMIYSEHVILDRALPRVEDGLKPVQRRILYTMYNLNMKPKGGFKKSARIVGDCMGKYHPHGDTSIYEAMARLTQDFSMRMPLIKGQGNFGTLTDPPAAMRYTEVEMGALGTELLRDIDKDTVRWNKNFDDTLDEPDLLPGRFPNLLVNGASGIAIGLATNIPTHNLTEVIDGCVAMLDNPRIGVEELMKYIKGPDFPSGGFLVGGEELVNAYRTGKGKLILRGRAEIEGDGDRQTIVVTELPWGANPHTLIDKIYTLREKKKEIFGNISEISDETTRSIRIVIKLKRGEDAVKILDGLYKYTDLQSSFSMNMVAIADGKPRLMGLNKVLEYYLNYQKQIVKSRSIYELGVAKKRAEILEGYLTVIPDIDEVIALIRSAANRTEAKQKLRARYSLSEVQAEAILSLQLGNLNKLDVGKYRDELQGLKKDIARLTRIKDSVREQTAVVRAELLEIRDRYKNEAGAKRLTTIIGDLKDVDVKPFDPTKRTAKRMIAAISADGGVKFMTSRSYIAANREAASGGIQAEHTALKQIEPGHIALIVGSEGNCYRIDPSAIRDRQWGEKAESLKELFPDAPSKEKATAIFTVDPENPPTEDVYIYTEQGMVKKSAMSAYIVGKSMYQVITLKDGDSVIGAEIETPGSTVLFVTSDGQCVNTLTDDYPEQGRIAGGVIGVNLNRGAKVVFAAQADVEIVEDENGNEMPMPLGEILVITEKGTGKRVIASEFGPMKRNRKGLRIIDIYGDDNAVGFAAKVLDNFKVVFEDDEGELHAVDTEEIRIEKKDTKGKPILRGVKIKRVFRHAEEI